MTAIVIKEVYLSIENFDKDIENCLTIITEPTQRNPYYVCEYVSPALYKSIVHIYITK
jgi:hypothetical protein